MAADRSYILEHMWVKLVAENIVAIGVTEKMADITDEIYNIYLPHVGDIIKKDDPFIFIEATKLSVEFFSPVSGTVLQLNNNIFSSSLGDLQVNADPYNRGWFVTIQLSNPEELNELLTPEEYRDLNAKVLE